MSEETDRQKGREGRREKERDPKNVIIATKLKVVHFYIIYVIMILFFLEKRF